MTAPFKTFGQRYNLSPGIDLKKYFENGSMGVDVAAGKETTRSLAHSVEQDNKIT